MKLSIVHQESYSRVQLLLRSFFGIFYIYIPHAFLFMFYSIYVSFLMIYAWFAILFTGKYPKIAFDAYVGMLRWQTRLNAVMFNMADGYPPFGPNAEWESVNLEVTYSEEVSRVTLLVRTFFGIFMLIPHIIILYVLMIAGSFLALVNWFMILFTGKVGDFFFNYFEGILRFTLRISLFTSFIYPSYPPFGLGEDEKDNF